MSDAVAVQLIVSIASMFTSVVSVVSILLTRKKVTKVQETLDALTRPSSRQSATAPAQKEFGDHLPGTER